MTNTTLPADERPIDSARKLRKYLSEFAPDYDFPTAQDHRILRVSERLLDLESDENSYTLTIEKLREENERLREVLVEMAEAPSLGSSVHREWDKRIARARAVLARMEVE